jgi:WD40 repeat protein
VLTASADKTARIWDAAGAKHLVEFRGHTDSVGFAWFSQDGSRARTVSSDGTIRVWDAESGAELLAPPNAGSVAFSSDGARITGDYEMVLIYDGSPVNRAIFHIAPRPRARP